MMISSIYLSVCLSIYVSIYLSIYVSIQIQKQHTCIKNTYIIGERSG